MHPLTALLYKFSAQMQMQNDLGEMRKILVQQFRGSAATHLPETAAPNTAETLHLISGSLFSISEKPSHLFLSSNLLRYSKSCLSGTRADGATDMSNSQVVHYLVQATTYDCVVRDAPRLQEGRSVSVVEAVMPSDRCNHVIQAAYKQREPHRYPALRVYVF